MAKLVKAKLDVDYPEGPDGKRSLSQKRIANAIGIVQPVLSDILAANGSVGVAALIRLRSWLKMPIDDLLDLAPLQDMTETLQSIDRRLAALETQSEPPKSAPPPAAPMVEQD